MRKHLPSLVVFVSCAILAVMVVITFSLTARSVDNKRKEVADRTTAEALWDRYDADIASCNRGDIVRTLLHDFLTAAEEARRSPPIEPGDIEAANKYAELDSRIWPLHTCKDIIPEPLVSRPAEEKS